MTGSGTVPLLSVLGCSSFSSWLDPAPMSSKRGR